MAGLKQDQVNFLLWKSFPKISRDAIIGPRLEKLRRAKCFRGKISFDGKISIIGN